MNETEKSLQERFAPENRCFGCGQRNERGLRIRSHPRGEELICEWTSEAHHEAWEGTVNGGICGALLDCHSNWTAAWHLMQRDGLAEPPPTVTGDFHVKLRRPTPSRKPLVLRARVLEATGPKVRVEASIECEGKLTATCTGTFVAVEPGHPAYHRW